MLRMVDRLEVCHHDTLNDPGVKMRIDLNRKPPYDLVLYPSRGQLRHLVGAARRHTYIPIQFDCNFSCLAEV